jgi:transposase
MLWILRTGAPWRDLPERYGPWRTVASPFYRWQRAGLWQHVFDAVKQPAQASGQLNWDLHDVESTIIRAHQHAAGAQKGPQRPKPSGAARAGLAPKCTCERRGMASCSPWC